MSSSKNKWTPSSRLLKRKQPIYHSHFFTSFDSIEISSQQFPFKWYLRENSTQQFKLSFLTLVGSLTFFRNYFVIKHDRFLWKFFLTHRHRVLPLHGQSKTTFKERTSSYMILSFVRFTHYLKYFSSAIWSIYPWKNEVELIIFSLPNWLLVVQISIHSLF